MQPTRSLILITLLWAIWGIVASLVPGWEAVWVWVGVVIISFGILDCIAVRCLPVPRVERELPGHFAVRAEQRVTLKLVNRASFSIKVLCYDGIPQEAESVDLPWSGKLPGKGFVCVEYMVLLSERGLKEFEKVYLKIFSPLRLWTRLSRGGELQKTRVYPDYKSVLRCALLAMENRADQMGMIKKQRAGMSREFHQLRDYREGDVPSQIDWKSTSKRLSLISRDYHEQRDQTVILALDCGKRMRALDGGVPQFDHCLNAALLVAYTALRQGDHVGIMGLGDTDRWLAPVRGVQSMETILNHLYDYETTVSPSDFSEAAERLLQRQRRRALVVLFSNVRGEDGHHFIEPMRTLRQRHVMVLASVRERSVEKRMDELSETLDDALEVGATALYLEERAEVFNKLREHSVFTVDTTADDLPIALAEAYLGAREKV